MIGLSDQGSEITGKKAVFMNILILIVFAGIIFSAVMVAEHDPGESEDPSAN